jgi:hypothetical protein
MVVAHLIQEIVDLTLRVNQEEVNASEFENLTVEELTEKRLELLVQLGPEYYDFD